MFDPPVWRGVLQVLLLVTLAGCTTSPGPKPSATFATAPLPTSTPTSIDAPTLPPEGPDEELPSLPAGTYTIHADLRITVEIPSGWGTCCGGIITGNDMAFFFMDLDEIVVFNDLCHWKTGGFSKPLGASAIADALAAQVGRRGSERREAMVAGLPGINLRLTVPSDTPVDSEGNFVGCDDGSLTSTDFRGHHGPGQVDDYYIVDVGSSTVAFDLVYGAGVAPADRAALESMLGSVKIGPR